MVTYRMPPWGWKPPPPLPPPEPRRPINSSPVGRSVPILIGTHKLQGELIWGEAPSGVEGGVVASFAFMFAFNHFDLTSKFIEIKFDDEVVYEGGLGQKLTLEGAIRVYPGTRSQDPDPYIQEKQEDENTPAWRGYTYFVGEACDLERFQDRIPITFATITNAYQASASAEVFPNLAEHTAAVADGFITTTFAFDWGLGRIYSIVEVNSIASTTMYVGIHDLNQREEISFVQIIDCPIGEAGNCQALDGSGYVIVASGSPKSAIVVDTETGEVVASVAIPITINIALTGSFLSGAGPKYFATGYGGSNEIEAAILVFDPADKTLTLALSEGESPGGTGFAGKWSSFASGRSADGYGSFFWAGDLEIWEYFIQGTTISHQVVYSRPVAPFITGCYYDAVNHALLVSLDDSTTKKINLYTSAEIWSVSTPTDAYLESAAVNALSRFGTIARIPDGYAAMRVEGGTAHYAISLATGSTVLLLNASGETSITAIDIARGIVYTRASEVWTATPFDSYAGIDIEIEDVLRILMRNEGYSESQLTFTGFTADMKVRGVVITSELSTRDLVRSITLLYGISFVESGSGIRFRKPPTDDSYTADFTFTEDDLCQMENGDVIALLNQTLAVEHDIPSSIELSHIDPDADYQPAITVAEMPTVPFSSTASDRKERYDTLLSFSPSEAKRRATEYLYRRQVEKRRFGFILPPDKAFIEPGDVGSITVDGETYTVLINRVNLRGDFTQEVEAVEYLSAVDASHSASSGTILTRPPTVSALCRYIHLDIPLLYAADDGNGTKLAQYHAVVGRTTETWGGANLWRSPNGTDPRLVSNWKGFRPVHGVATTALVDYADPLNSLDNYNSVTIRLIGGNIDDLVDITDTQINAGQNRFALGREGRWEIIGFGNATDNGDGTVTLSVLKRGQRGTDVFTDTHLIGDLFVFLAPNRVEKLYYPFTDLDEDYYFYAVARGDRIENAIPEKKTILGAAEKPYAPIISATLEGSPSDVHLTGIRGSRIDGAYGNDTTLGETSEEYEIDIISKAGSPSDDEIVLTTITGLSSLTYTITEAALIAAYGSYPTTLYLRAYQISQTLEAQNGSGRGLSRLTEIAL